MFETIQLTDQNPDLYRREREDDFATLIIDAVQLLESADEVIQRYEGFDLEGRRAGMEEEFGDDESYKELVEMLGEEDLVNELVAGVTGNDKSGVSDERYQEARRERDKAGIMLIEQICGYKAYMKTNLVELVGESKEEAEENAWAATWKKIHSILSTAEGTLLAEVAGFIDNLIKEEFDEKYKAMETDRGQDVNQDITARTFYLVMEKHTHRAIIGATRDEWTGYQ